MHVFFANKRLSVKTQSFTFQLALINYQIELYGINLSSFTFWVQSPHIQLNQQLMHRTKSQQYNFSIGRWIWMYIAIHLFVKYLFIAIYESFVW